MLDCREDKLFGYNEEGLRAKYFTSFESFTPNAIRKRIDHLKHAISENRGHIFITIGENCGPSLKLREVEAHRLGGGFFDNIVIQCHSIPELLHSRFSSILRLRDLEVGEWESHDSIYDRRSEIYFHHYFMPRGVNEKDDFSRGYRRRRIDETDIPLFLGSVTSQFEYLIEKFILLAQAPCIKTYVLRRILGAPVDSNTYESLRYALERLGAINFDIAVIYSQGEPENTVSSRHVFIPEHDGEERWGSRNHWEKFVKIWPQRRVE